MPVTFRCRCDFSPQTVLVLTGPENHLPLRARQSPRRTAAQPKHSLRLRQACARPAPPMPWRQGAEVRAAFACLRPQGGGPSALALPIHSCPHLELTLLPHKASSGTLCRPGGSLASVPVSLPLTRERARGTFVLAVASGSALLFHPEPPGPSLLPFELREPGAAEPLMVGELCCSSDGTRPELRATAGGAQPGCLALELVLVLHIPFVDAAPLCLTAEALLSGPTTPLAGPVCWRTAPPLRCLPAGGLEPIAEDSKVSFPARAPPRTGPWEGTLSDAVLATDAFTRRERRERESEREGPEEGPCKGGEGSDDEPGEALGWATTAARLSVGLALGTVLVGGLAASALVGQLQRARRRLTDAGGVRGLVRSLS